MELDSSQSQNSKIHLLPEHLIDQIKAGEVIERPASLIKEIIENSIDAGSTQIELHLINCGIDLISLEDNGKGMSFEDLPYAFCRHATSKIERFEDLYKLSSFGFRGEALASISAISRITCTSHPEHDPENGGKIIIHGGETKAHAQQPGSKAGTSLFIKDLFYNTPARLKFIKSQISEKNALKRVIQSFILSNPHVSFSIKWDDADKEFYPATGEDFQKRIAQVFYKSKNQHELYEFSAEYEGHTVRAFFSTTSTKGNSYKKQYLFANHRLFTDKQIHQTIIRNCEGLYPQGEMGNYCVFLDVPPNLIDVNVHPNKTQIKFFKLPVLTALLSSELKKLKATHNQNFADEQSQMSFENYSSPNQALSHTHSSAETSKNFQSYAQSLGQFQKPLRPQMGDMSPQDDSPSLHEAKLISSEPSPIQQVTDDKGNLYLIHKFKFMMNFLEERAQKQNDDLNDYIPLLISSPIRIKEEILPSLHLEKELKKLLQYGLQVEQMDKFSLVLRSYHKSYLDFPIEDFLVHYFNEGLKLDFLLKTSFQFNKKWCLPLLDENQGVLHINAETLENLFS